MLQLRKRGTIEEAGGELLGYILKPQNWVALDQLGIDPESKPGENPAYQRQVGKLCICASVDVTSTLDVFLRVGFRAPGLSPMKATDYLEAFLRSRFPFTPNCEWQVEIDSRRWIHFIRRYTALTLEA